MCLPGECPHDWHDLIVESLQNGGTQLLSWLILQYVQILFQLGYLRHGPDELPRFQRFVGKGLHGRVWSKWAIPKKNTDPFCQPAAPCPFWPQIFRLGKSARQSMVKCQKGSFRGWISAHVQCNLSWFCLLKLATCTPCSSGHPPCFWEAPENGFSGFPSEMFLNLTDTYRH